MCVKLSAQLGMGLVIGILNSSVAALRVEGGELYPNLRSFLSRDLVIENLVFVERPFPGAIEAGTKKVGAGVYLTVKEAHRHKIMLQDDAFLFQGLDAPTSFEVDGHRGVAETAVLCGYYRDAASGGNLCWSLQPDHSITYYRGRMLEHTNGMWVHDHVIGKRALARDARNFGIQGLSVGKAEWSGDLFHVIGATGTNIAGSLIKAADSNGYSGVKYTNRFRPGVFHIAFEYDSSKFQGKLPFKAVRTYYPDPGAARTPLDSPRSEANGGLTELALEYQEIKITNAGLEPEKFAADVPHRTKVRRIYTLTPEGTVYTNRNQRLIVGGGADGGAASLDGRRSLFRFIFVLFSTIGLASLWFLARNGASEENLRS